MTFQLFAETTLKDKPLLVKSLQNLTQRHSDNSYSVICENWRVILLVGRKEGLSVKDLRNIVRQILTQKGLTRHQINYLFHIDKIKINSKKQYLKQKPKSLKDAGSVSSKYREADNEIIRIWESRPINLRGSKDELPNYFRDYRKVKEQYRERLTDEYTYTPEPQEEVHAWTTKQSVAEVLKELGILEEAKKRLGIGDKK